MRVQDARALLMLRASSASPQDYTVSPGRAPHHSIRQHVAAVGRRVATLCKGEDGLQQLLALSHVYDTFCLPHASLRQARKDPAQ